MSSLIILFLAVIGPLNNVEAAPAQALDINKILELVQQERLNSGSNKQRRLQLRQDSTDTDSDLVDSHSKSGEGDDSDSNRVARLRKQRIIDLIEKVANEKKYGHESNDRVSHRNGKPNYIQKIFKSHDNKLDNPEGANNLKKQIFETLFSKGLIDEERKTKQRANYLQKKHLTPTLSLNKLNDYKMDAVNGLEDYSKVYVVLNPQAVQKSRNKNALNDLISKVLSLSGSTSKKSRQVNKKPRRYKGFVINEDHALRRSRQSKESYYRRDSMGDEYNRKRLRSGGNPGAGRTSIPYIRHRGDIYERDD